MTNTIIPDAPDTVEADEDMQPCPDPTCISSEHDMSEYGDYEHRSALTISRPVEGGKYEIYVGRSLRWYPGYGTPPGWFVDVYISELSTTPAGIDQMIADLVEARQACIEANTEMVRRERLAEVPLNEIITTEIAAMISDREWSTSETAMRFGMTSTKLTSRLRGHTLWNATDVAIAAHALVGDGWPELVTRWYTVGSDRSSDATVPERRADQW